MFSKTLAAALISDPIATALSPTKGNTFVLAPQKTLATIILLSLSSCFLQQIYSVRAHDGFTRSETLAEDYILEWSVDFENNKIFFSIRARTLGYVGFGISLKGAMDGADMIIGGVYDNGTAYLTDGHGVGNQFVKDQSQDWILHDAFESDGWTTLNFKRLLRPCDEAEDVPITEDTLRVIYSYGETDQAEYHKNNRGVQSLKLLNPTSRLGQDTLGFNALNVSVKLELPDDSTVYWESVHCFPNFKSKVHIVGFEAILPTIEAQKHVHHINAYRCTTPEDPTLAAYLQALSNTTGGNMNDPSVQIASLFCREFSFVWSVGGYPVFYPEDIGIPFGSRDNQECYRLETHVNNPENLKGLKIDTGMTLYYTKELRKYDGGVLTVGTHPANPHLIIPPGMKGFVHAGHCSSTCTSAALPQDGIKVFGVTPHTHIHGRKIKVRHFRGTTELPWLVADDHYDFNYQQYNAFREQVQLLPGDQLVTECAYATAEASHTGTSTLQEMCLAFFWVYPKVPDLFHCMSAFWPPEEVLHPLGIGSLNSSDLLNPVVSSPPEIEGLTLLDALNHKVNWTDEKINNLQNQMRWKKQIGICRGEYTVHLVPGVSYPNNFKVYEPKFKCQMISSGVSAAQLVGSVLPIIISVAFLVGRRIGCV